MVRRAIGMIAPWLLLLLVIGLDAQFRGSELPFFKEAVVDETAHVATALIVLLCIAPQAGIPIVFGAVIGSTAIDVDHLPAMAGSLILTAGTNRPYTHSLLTVAFVILLGFMLPSLLRRFMWGVTVGVIAHLLRDMATGGVPFFWPLATSSVTVPYHLYLVALVAGACIALVREAAPVSNRVHRLLLPD